MVEPSEKKIEKVEKEKSVEEKLDGCTLVLDPKKSGFFKDEKNDITLHFFDDSHDKIEFKKTMDATEILRNIKVGILRVEKNGKDISTKFGGTEVDNNEWNRIPIVEGVPKKVNIKKDEPYLNVLGRNDQKEIIRDINSINDLAMLERLMELEVQGNNPSSKGRANVVDAIKKAIKNTPGVGEAKEVKESKKDIISTK